MDENGTASYQTTYQVTLANREENFLLDEDGSALIVHAEADDYENTQSQPSDQFTSGIVENEASTLFLMRLAALAGVGLLVFSATRRICDS